MPSCRKAVDPYSREPARSERPPNHAQRPRPGGLLPLRGSGDRGLAPSDAASSTICGHPPTPARSSAYIAKDTLDTATALGLQLCFTPVRSPESNGIAEAFVKTFKRDYARLLILPDAATVIALLPAWFEDYNEVHPHSGLKFLSPREFLRLSP